jgi:hypothetical protein
MWRNFKQRCVIRIVAAQQRSNTKDFCVILSLASDGVARTFGNVMKRRWSWCRRPMTVRSLSMLTDRLFF